MPISDGEVRADFETDWYFLAREQILHQGYELAPLVLHQDDYGYQLFALRRRRPDALPRTLHFATHFHCPDELQPGLELLGHDVANGADLRDRMSRRVVDLLDDDGLSEWCIFPFQLPPPFGELPRDERRALWACVTRDRFLCLGVHAERDWTQLRYLDTVWAAWPDVFEPHRIPVDSEAMAAGRHERGEASGTFVRLADGSVLTGPTRSATAARREASEMVRLVRRFESKLIDRRAGILGSLARLQPPPAYPVHFRLVFCESGELGAQIEGTSLTVRLT